MKHSNKLKNIETVIDAQTPTLASFSRAKGNEFTEGLITVWLMYLNEMLNLKKLLSPGQMELIATNVVADYGSLKISDITYIFKKVINGDYGELYESLTVPKVMTWFKQHTQERMDTAEQMSIRQHQAFSQDDTFNYSSTKERIWKGAKGFNR